jgi:hypothetical protein
MRRRRRRRRDKKRKRRRTRGRGGVHGIPFIAISSKFKAVSHH